MNYKLIKIYYQFHFFNMNSIQTILQQYNVDGQITGLPQDKLVEILALIRKPKTLKKTKRENNPLCKKHKIAIAMRLGINTKDTHKQSICGGKNCHNRSYCDIGCTGCPGIEIEKEEIALEQQNQEWYAGINLDKIVKIIQDTNDNLTKLQKKN